MRVTSFLIPTLSLVVVVGAVEVARHEKKAAKEQARKVSVLSDKTKRLTEKTSKLELALSRAEEERDRWTKDDGVQWLEEWQRLFGQLPPDQWLNGTPESRENWALADLAARHRMTPTRMKEVMHEAAGRILADTSAAVAARIRATAFEGKGKAALELARTEAAMLLRAGAECVTDPKLKPERTKEVQLAAALWDPNDPAGVEARTQRAIFNEDLTGSGTLWNWKEMYEQRLRARGEEDEKTLQAQKWLAAYYQRDNDVTHAAEMFRQVLVIEQRLHGVDSVESAEALMSLGHALEHENPVQAEPLYRQALEIRKKLLPPDHPALAESTRRLSDLLERGSRLKEAEKITREDLDRVRAAVPPDHPQVTANLIREARKLSQKRRLPEAVQLIREALSGLETRLGPNDPQVGECLESLAQFLVEDEEYAEAEPLLDRALELWENQPDVDMAHLSSTLRLKGTLLQSSARTEEAQEMHHFRQALGVLKGNYSQPKLVLKEIQLGKILSKQGKKEEAVTQLRKAVETAKTTQGGTAILTALATVELAAQLEANGKLEDAAVAYQEGLSIWEKNLNVDGDMLAWPLTRLGVCQEAAGKKEDAEAHYRQAFAIYKKHYGPHTYLMLPPQGHLALVLDTMGRRDEARLTAKEAVELASVTRQDNSALAHELREKLAAWGEGPPKDGGNSWPEVLSPPLTAHLLKFTTQRLPVRFISLPLGTFLSQQGVL